ncbi:hypothetical protein CVT26_014426 [Gymnopilus dilepis]|uniref:Uncharacterized protein n=1 Tax=Gymnopilus dilepis TaxID=231916 RepID=A0A409X1T4_9AGAR|nr:hypothetical protein CVT26_014426 [Gymnopilus dilepis]
MDNDKSVKDPASLPDVAEDFVATFYHDPEDEINTEEEDDDFFRLYEISRPLTPLSIEELGHGSKKIDPQEWRSSQSPYLGRHQQHSEHTTTLETSRKISCESPEQNQGNSVSNTEPDRPLQATKASREPFQEHYTLTVETGIYFPGHTKRTSR